MATKKNQPSKPNRWRNNIVGQGKEAPDQLLANPRNWRMHPKHQQDAMEGVLDQIGWLQQVIVNNTTGHLIDGHLRVELAMKHDEPEVPVIYVEMSEEDEDIALATLDPLGNLAAPDRAKLKDLLKKVGASTDNPAIQDLLAQTAKNAKVTLDSLKKVEPEKFEDLDEELEGVHMLSDELKVWESDAPYGIPPLRKDMIYSVPDPQKLKTWCGNDLLQNGTYTDEDNLWLWPVGSSMKELPRERSIFAFYAEDWKFEGFWSFPSRWGTKMLNGKFAAAIVPNFSTQWFQPKAVNIYQFYRSAWCGRYLQEAGIPIIPDLKTDGEGDFDLSFAGIPKGTPSVAVQIQTFDPSNYEETVKKQASFVAAIERLEPELTIVYGSKAGRAALGEVAPEGANVIYLPSAMDMRRDHIQAKTEDERRFKS